MRRANLLTAPIARFNSALLAIALGVLLLALPAVAAAATMASIAMPGVDSPVIETPAAFSLTHLAPQPALPHVAARRAPAPRTARLFGYPSANADELPPPPAPAPPALLFSHAALGVALLDAPGTGEATDASLDSGHLSATQVNLTVPAPLSPAMPSPLPIGLIVALVLLPAGVVLGQALLGPSRRPRAAMRRHGTPRQHIND